MAEEDAEIALLHKMQADQESVAWDGGADDAAYEGELPSNTENSDQDQDVQENFAVADDQILSVPSPSVTGVDSVSASLNSALAGDAPYDVLSPLPAAVPVPLADPATVTVKMSSAVSLGLSPAASALATSNESRMSRKTIGGFLADDSDDEESNDPPKVSISGRDNMNIARPSGDRNYRVAQSVPVQELTPLPSGPPEAGTNVPKARLPHDRVGILEDRIKEDPRGDLDAWLSLISEHRKRNKLDDARAVYERLFKVFPSAVSTQLSLQIFASLAFRRPAYSA
jgi:cleavage stimulation factor subunit 3